MANPRLPRDRALELEFAEDYLHLCGKSLRSKQHVNKDIASSTLLRHGHLRSPTLHTHGDDTFFMNRQNFLFSLDLAASDSERHTYRILCSLYVRWSVNHLLPADSVTITFLEDSTRKDYEKTLHLSGGASDFPTSPLYL